MDTDPATNSDTNDHKGSSYAHRPKAAVSQIGRLFPQVSCSRQDSQEKVHKGNLTDTSFPLSKISASFAKRQSWGPAICAWTMFVLLELDNGDTGF
jgi:hypothetical protein